MGRRSPHEILGVPPGASHEEIVRAYRGLAVKYHPDKRKDDGRFLIIQKAYEAIKDFKPAEKKEADRDPGADLRVSISASMKDVADGRTKTIRYSRKTLCRSCEKVCCQACGGTGRDPVSLVMGPVKKCRACSGTGRKKSGCHSCKGTGFIEEKASVDITLNPMMTGPVVMKGKGNEGESGNGNLIIELFIDKDRTYQMSGLNLKRSLDISPVQAIVGDFIQLDVFGKQVGFAIPPGVQDGQMVRKDKAGLSYNGRMGDLCVTVSIKTPKVISEHERGLYLEILNIEKENICRNL